MLLLVTVDGHGDRYGDDDGRETGVAVLADVTVSTLCAALADLLVAAGGTWVLTPRDGPTDGTAWDPDASLRGLGVLDGTRVLLRRRAPGDLSDVSDARS